MTGTPTSQPRGSDRVSAIASVLQDNILSGHYEPGDRLPSEADLCAHFSVSRPTLREALGRLTARGMIVSKRGAGGGAFVTRPDPAKSSEEISALVGLSTRMNDNAHRPLLIEARIQMQMAAAELAVLRQSDISDLRSEIDLQSDFEIPDSAFISSLKRMHLALSEASGNPALAMLAQGLIEAEFAITPSDPIPTRIRARYLSYHVRVVNGIAGGRADDTREALTELWGFEQRQATGEVEAERPVEQPPRMRDLRLPPVQRLKPLDPVESAPDESIANQSIAGESA